MKCYDVRLWVTFINLPILSLKMDKLPEKVLFCQFYLSWFYYRFLLVGSSCTRAFFTGIRAHRAQPIRNILYIKKTDFLYALLPFLCTETTVDTSLNE